MSNSSQASRKNIPAFMSGPQGGANLASNRKAVLASRLHGKPATRKHGKPTRG